MSKRSERLFEAISDVDEQKIDEAAPENRRSQWKRWGVLAAALVLAVGIGSRFLPQMDGGDSSTPSQPGVEPPVLSGVEGDGAAGSGAEPAKISYALAEPVYPEYPQEPVFPMDGGDQAWDDYFEANDAYWDALMELKDGNFNLTQAEKASLSAFAARSTPLALAGQEGENTIYSPLSLWAALSMLAQCAEGDSRQQVLDALGADSVEALQEEVSSIWQVLYTDDGVRSLILSSSIWLSDAAQGTCVPETLDTLAQKYFAGTYSVPMGTAEADQAVTDWVKRQTNGLIGGDAPVVQTDPETLALLASTLYYQTPWMEEFDLDETEEDLFTGAGGQESRVEFMHRVQDDSFLRREGWQAASLETQLGSMIFVLPDEGAAPESLLQDPEFLSSLDFSEENTVFGEVRWSVPKFEVDSELNLLDTLAALGITDLLDAETADLSALTNLDAYLSEAKQLARVKVDEKGVEAAAFTLLGLELGGWLPPEDPEVCVMNLNRPFLFVICVQDVPLFVGIVNQVG